MNTALCVCVCVCVREREREREMRVRMKPNNWSRPSRKRMVTVLVLFHMRSYWNKVPYPKCFLTIKKNLKTIRMGLGCLYLNKTEEKEELTIFPWGLPRFTVQGSNKEHHLESFSFTWLAIILFLLYDIPFPKGNKSVSIMNSALTYFNYAL